MLHIPLTGQVAQWLHRRQKSGPRLLYHWKTIASGNKTRFYSLITKALRFVGKLIVFWLFMDGLAMPALAQRPAGLPLSNLRVKQIPAKPESVQLDTLSILPGTVSVPGINPAWYTIDNINAQLTWKQHPPVDSITVRYRVFDRRLNAVSRHLNYDSIMNNFLVAPYVYNDNGFGKSERFFDFGTINYTGSFGRGISFGNSQDAVVTSSLNLQLNGYLADSIEITAAITDNNIPIQPDGTTQQLNEFDRIFLQFKKKTWALSLGDIDIRQNKSYFLKFYKRLQGVAFETTSKLAPGVVNSSLLSGSIAKGKFTRNVFQGQEGNQGPYRLQGANNEFYFVLLANTEKVFIDGELLQRGEDRDYVINYNTAEITFTPKRMITKDTRIQVEFEYADRNYLNANLYFTNQTSINDRLRVTVSAFSNSDAKSSPINQTLDPAQKIFLRGIGDSINNAYYKIAVPDTFSAGKILYKKVDTLLANGIHDTAFVYSVNPDSSLYSLSFVNVGFGKGDYLPDDNAANGKVYKYVAPQNGVKQGQFEAAIFLVTPKKQQLVSVLVDYDLSKKTNLTTELAYSNYDVNTFSTIDKADNKGYAAKFRLSHNGTIPGDQKLRLLTDAGLEYADARFHPLEVLRNVEFLRDWGLPLLLPAATETITTAGAQLEDARKNILRYQFTDYKRSSDFNGVRNTITQVQTLKNWQFNNQFSLSQTNSSTEKGFFFRPVFDISKKFTKLHNYRLTGHYALEQNIVRIKQADSVNATSFSFRILQFSLNSPGTSGNKWGITYFMRTNSYPFGKDLAKSDVSSNINLTGDLLKNPHHRFRWNVSYRKLTVTNSAVTNQQADQTVLGRGEYQVNTLRGMLTGNLLYEAGSGQEQKREYAFLEVPAGQGQYTWIDYNNDGVQQLNEFELAVFQDQAKYIKIYTPSNQFIKANYNTFNYSILLNPRSAIDLVKSGKLLKFIARLNVQSSLQTAKKEIANGIIQLNPFKLPISDTALISLNSIFVNSFSFNRFSTRWGLDVTHSSNSGKSLLTYGLESRTLQEWSTRARINISKSMLFDITGKTGSSGLITDNQKFQNRNYDIRQYSFEPRLSITKGTIFRVITGYKYSNKKNQSGSNEQYSSNSVNTEVKYNILQSASLLSKFTYSRISFSPLASANSTVGYNMLDGLSPGKNFLWSVELTKRLANNLEINIQYEGRKPGESRIVHVGRASVRALF
jgi:hypothetical protein